MVLRSCRNAPALLHDDGGDEWIEQDRQSFRMGNLMGVLAPTKTRPQIFLPVTSPNNNEASDAAAPTGWIQAVLMPVKNRTRRGEEG